MLGGSHGQVRKKEEGRELSRTGEGSSAPDQDSKELNATMQPHPDGICSWVQNGTLIKIKLDK